MYAKIALLKTSRAIDRLYTYRVDGEDPIGCRVIVRFGRHNGLKEGVVMETTEEAPNFDTKPVEKVLTALRLDAKDLALVRFMRETYLATYEEALRLLLPAGTRLVTEDVYEVLRPGDFDPSYFGLDPEIRSFTRSSLDDRKSQQAWRKELSALVRSGVLSHRIDVDSRVSEVTERYYRLIRKKEELLEEVPAHHSALRRLIKVMPEEYFEAYGRLRPQAGVPKATFDTFVERGWAEVTESVLFDRLSIDAPGEEDPLPPLTADQQRVVDAVERGGEHLLHGVTGSGKTEVYMHLVHRTLVEGKGAILLVPEIALTTQLVRRFARYFGQEMAVLHSKLSLGERYDAHRLIATGKKRFVIGARSAIFSPVRDLGIVIIDEEHEATYKSEHSPRYETSEIARFRAGQTGATLLGGTATPRLESFHRAMEKEIGYLKLTQRYNERALPGVRIVDLRTERQENHRLALSRPLITAIGERLERQEQVMLLYNRKGYASLITCESCGHKISCPDCDITLTYYKDRHHLRCHYCDHREVVPKVCPACGAPEMVSIGSGTEKIEEEIRSLFPEARILRLDANTTRTKNHLEEAIDRIENREVDLIVGTQMIAKGFDFPLVTLIGVLLADQSLDFPDFRAAERTFQLLTQVAGRAGRGGRPGEVILQTYAPDHYVLGAIARYDYYAFAREELKIRRFFGYPPYRSVARLLFTGSSAGDAEKTSNNVHNILKKNLYNEHIFHTKITLYEPHPTLVAKVRQKFRYHILIKYDRSQEETLKEIIRQRVINDQRALLVGDTFVTVDFSPAALT
jgi:primosomal protein N' (replication factor Y)